MNTYEQRKMKRPYEDIYVYNIQGEVSDDAENILGETFLGNWVEDDSSFLFFSANSDRMISELLKRYSGLILLDDYHFSYEEWQGGEFDTVRIGRFVITPPWRDLNHEIGEIGVVLDPGVVFGTGLHPTTRSCLRALLCLHEIFAFQKVLDLGTGTGILAVAAAALGASEVTALDLNPLAVKTARKNIILNGFEKRIDVIKDRAESYMNRAVELLIANIHYDVIKGLFEQKRISEIKWFIISGLMRSQALEFRDSLKKKGIEIKREWDHEMTWYTFLLRKIGPRG